MIPLPNPTDEDKKSAIVRAAEKRVLECAEAWACALMGDAKTEDDLMASIRALRAARAKRKTRGKK
jgi:hypothetical protein